MIYCGFTIVSTRRDGKRQWYYRNQDTGDQSGFYPTLAACKRAIRDLLGLA